MDLKINWRQVPKIHSGNWIWWKTRKCVWLLGNNIQQSVKFVILMASRHLYMYTKQRYRYYLKQIKSIYVYLNFNNENKYFIRKHIYVCVFLSLFCIVVGLFSIRRIVCWKPDKQTSKYGIQHWLYVSRTLWLTPASIAVLLKILTDICVRRCT